MAQHGTRRAVAEQLYAAVGAGDLDTVIGLLAPDVEWELVGPPEIPYFGRYAGIDQVRMFFELLGEHCIVESLEPQRFTVADDVVVVEGVERGSFRGHPEPYEMRWCHLMNISGGRIVRFTDHMDTAPMLAAWRS
jgi:uncharacterized protein